ncbi:MAG: FadR family transcriptional regulator [Gammaproteobacteria bacterium]|nr:FadR family transcriptional regulator [Gammaproteobacteria bacterium]
MRKTMAHNLTFDIVQRLGQEVVSGKYVQDLKFPTEAELCDEYDVSRSVMREAVKILTGKGLLSARPRRGTEVTEETQWNLLDPDVLNWLLKRDLSLPLLIEFTEMRLGVEPEAAALAARSATEAQKDRIMETFEGMVRASRGESDPLETDIAFHLAVLEASNNRFMLQLDGLIDTALRFSIRLTNRLKGVEMGNVEEHRMVADAIVAGDAEKARRCMLHMQQEARDLYARQLQIS